MTEKHTLQQMKEVKMTAEEKARVWDGVLRRTTDYPDGQYPFNAENTWDGVFRRKSSFPDLRAVDGASVRKIELPRLHTGESGVSSSDRSFAEIATKVMLLVLLIAAILFILSLN